MSKNIYQDILFDFQKKVVDKALPWQKYGLFMQPGLGKTLTSLAIAQEKKFSKILVICQHSKKIDWANDINTFLSLETTILGNGLEEDNKSIANLKQGAIIANYETIWRRKIKLDSEWLLIIDESQYLKSRKSKIGKWGAQHAKLCGGVLLLSGTPQNAYHDLYNQMVMLGMEMKYSEFENEFCEIKEVKLPTARWPFKTIVGYKNIDVLLNALKSVSITMKTEEAIDLPKQTFIDVVLEHDRPQVYAKVKKHQMYENDLFANPGVTYTRLREFASGYIGAYRNLSNHKAIALKEFLESNDKNVSIFYNFHAELDDITLVANTLGIKLFVVKGGLSEYEAFKEYKGNQRKIIAINYGSGAEGLNLQELDTQIYYSPCIPFIKYEQSLARIHRIGQTKPVFYYRYITKNTIEERIYQSLAKGEDYNERLFMKEEYGIEK